MGPRPVVMWFRDDLRLADNPALTAAAAAGPVIALFVLDDSGPDPRALGGAARWWLSRSLVALRADLALHGVPLVLRRGPAATIVPALLREAHARALAVNPARTPGGRAADVRLFATLAPIEILPVKRNAGLLHDPAAAPARVFTPFWKRLRSTLVLPAPLPVPNLAGAPPLPSESLETWSLEPSAPDWSGGLRTAWTPGEAGAAARLAAFLDEGLAGYGEGRDFPDRARASLLSPHLRFGELTPAQLFTAVATAQAAGRVPMPDADKFLAELGWREFAYNLLHHNPNLAQRNVRPGFDAFPWQANEVTLRAWQRGRTGYPLVDAGMRQLWQTGWMHNRVRMVAASFLTKHLLQDWRAGEAWFWDTLVDADPASNPANWQWVAGCGADAAPYFRIFNPVLQGQKFDPDGSYVRRFIPELRRMPARYIHEPWTAPPAILAAAEVRLGVTYPLPLVGHEAARRRALAAFATLKLVVRL